MVMCMELAHYWPLWEETCIAVGGALHSAMQWLYSRCTLALYSAERYCIVHCSGCYLGELRHCTAPCSTVMCGIEGRHCTVDSDECSQFKPTPVLQCWPRVVCSALCHTKYWWSSAIMYSTVQSCDMMDLKVDWGGGTEGRYYGHCTAAWMDWWMWGFYVTWLISMKCAMDF